VLAVVVDFYAEHDSESTRISQKKNKNNIHSTLYLESWKEDVAINEDESLLVPGLLPIINPPQANNNIYCCVLAVVVDLYMPSTTQKAPESSNEKKTKQ
jgi:hypothetical protein